MTSLRDKHLKYESVLTARYNTSKELLRLFSDHNRTITWRTLWIWLAEAQHELGLNVTAAQLEALRQHRDDVDWDLVKSKEAALRHDVMAHIEAYKAVVGEQAGRIIHQGATSAFVQDNTEILIVRDALQHTIRSTAKCLYRLGVFASTHKALVTVGRTHYQPASLTTVGKRACIWGQELLIAYGQLTAARDALRFRGAKGATGTQNSYLSLCGGDGAKVKRMDELIAQKAGFAGRLFRVTGQTYSRQLDTIVLNALALIGSAVHKICSDIRLLQAFGEMQEPFEDTQVGSSAMPHKRNPMRSERACALARYLMSLPQNALQTAALHGFERTLDDSANKRIIIPDGFLCADVMLSTLRNILQGLTVNLGVTAAHVRAELPTVCAEGILMALVKTGRDRQECHHKLKEIMVAATQEMQSTGTEVDVLGRVRSDGFFAPILDQLDGLLDPQNCIGRCVEQVDEFVKDELGSVFEQFTKEDLDETSVLTV